MKNKRLFWISLVILLSVGLVVSTVAAPVVQARDLETGLYEESTAPAKGAKPTQVVYNPAAYSEEWGITPDMLVDCDPDGTLLANTNPGSATTFHKLQTAACRQQTFLDIQKATEQKKALEAATAIQGNCGAGSGFASQSCGNSGVSGESTQMKIAGITSDVRYVFLQCGKKVGVIAPPTCSCGLWAYNYSCKRPPTVYITLPCLH